MWPNRRGPETELNDARNVNLHHHAHMNPGLFTVRAQMRSNTGSQWARRASTSAGLRTRDGPGDLETQSLSGQITIMGKPRKGVNIESNSFELLHDVADIVEVGCFSCQDDLNLCCMVWDCNGIACGSCFNGIGNRIWVGLCCSCWANNSGKLLYRSLRIQEGYASGI